MVLAEDSFKIWFLQGVFDLQIVRVLKINKINGRYIGVVYE